MTVFRAFLYLFIYLLRLFMRPAAVNEKKCFSLRLFRQEPEQGSAPRCNGMLLIVSASSRLPESRRELHPLPASSPLHFLLFFFFLCFVQRLNKYFIYSVVNVVTPASTIDNRICFISLPSLHFHSSNIVLAFDFCLVTASIFFLSQVFPASRPLHLFPACSCWILERAGRGFLILGKYLPAAAVPLCFLSASSLFVRTSRPQEPEQLFSFSRASLELQALRSSPAL